MTRPVPNNMFFIWGIQVFPVSYKRERLGAKEAPMKLFMIYYSQVSAMPCISSGNWAAAVSDYHATPISCLRKDGVEGLDVQRATRGTITGGETEIGVLHCRMRGW